MANKSTVIVDLRLIREKDARVLIEKLLFLGKKPADNCERSARISFMNCVMAHMKNGGKFVSPN